MLLLVLTLLCLHAVNGHMWLRSPVSRGGIDNIGGTNSPCNGLNSGGSVTTYEVGQKVNFQFRVNQHGPAPFNFTLLDVNNKALKLNATTGLLPTLISNTVTAGPDGFDGVNVPVTIPNYLCSNCAIQLAGMGQTTGQGTWYNCASVSIVPAGTLAIPLPNAVKPATGSTSGGGNVIVSGSGFGITAKSIYCQFGDYVVTGVYINSTEAQCPVPPYNNPTTSTIEISTDGGKTFSNTGTIFTYTGSTIIPVISSVTASAFRGSNITITGQYFYSNTMQCKFNNVTVVKAVVLSNTQCVCLVPSTETTNTTVTVIVSVDNSPYSAAASFLVSAPTTANSDATVVKSSLATTLLFAAVICAWFVKQN